MVCVGEMNNENNRTNDKDQIVSGSWEGNVTNHNTGIPGIRDRRVGHGKVISQGKEG